MSLKHFLVSNRYRRKRPKVDASIFDSALSHTRRSEASEKKKNILASTSERFRLWTSLEASPVSFKFSCLKNRLKFIHPRCRKGQLYSFEFDLFSRGVFTAHNFKKSSNSNLRY